MARIKHIALVTDDPVKTAEFYKQHFGLTELYRRPSETGENGVWLSDGYIYFAILKYGTPTRRGSGRARPPICAASTTSASRSTISRRPPRIEGGRGEAGADGARRAAA